MNNQIFEVKFIKYDNQLHYSISNQLSDLSVKLFVDGHSLALQEC